jgi:hypothetical protein
LNFLIEQKLRFHEVDRYGFAELPIEVIDEELDRIRARFDSEEEFRERLAELSLAEQSLRQIVARQVMVWIYVEERLGARVFVGLDDVQRYYDEVFVPQLVEQRQTVPPLQEVREPIGVVLREQRMNEELERWTLELHQQADIEDFFDSRHASLPPVVFTVGGKSD